MYVLLVCKCCQTFVNVNLSYYQRAGQIFNINFSLVVMLCIMSATVLVCEAAKKKCRKKEAVTLLEQRF